MSITEHMHISTQIVEPAPRIEVFTASGRRRSWSAEEKARIIAESASETGRCPLLRAGTG
jgi:hypothetical protein